MQRSPAVYSLHIACCSACPEPRVRQRGIRRDSVISGGNHRLKPAHKHGSTRSVTSNPGQTLGFALAKGLISGLTRCQPAVEIFNVLSIFGCILVESTLSTWSDARMYCQKRFGTRNLHNRIFEQDPLGSYQTEVSSVSLPYVIMCA